MEPDDHGDDGNATAVGIVTRTSRRSRVRAFASLESLQIEDDRRTPTIAAVDGQERR